MMSLEFSMTKANMESLTLFPRNMSFTFSFTECRQENTGSFAGQM